MCVENRLQPNESVIPDAFEELKNKYLVYLFKSFTITPKRKTFTYTNI